MNICILGNSHVGALKRASDQIGKTEPQVEMVFFAQRGRGMADMVVNNGKLAPDNKLLSEAILHTSGGMNEIDPDRFDVFVLYGLGARASLMDPDQFYSQAAVTTALNDLVTGTVANDLLHRLRQITDKPIYLGHDPLRSADQVQHQDSPTAYLAGIQRINRLVYEPMRAKLIAQPLATIVNGRNTHPDFSKGSKRLAVGDGQDDQRHPKSDTKHMNDEFGRLWLENLFSELSVTPKSGALNQFWQNLKASR